MFLSPSAAPLPIDSHRWRWTFYIAIVVLLISGGLALRRCVRFSEATHRVEHTYQVLTTIDELLAGLLDAETGQRGFLLTKSETFLALLPRRGPEDRRVGVGTSSSRWSPTTRRKPNGRER